MHMTFDMKFDELNPIDKIDILAERGLAKIIKISKDLIVILHMLNNCFQDKFGKEMIYFLDDKSVFFVAKKSFGYYDEELKDALIILDYCDLIYRFTCAKKFKVDDNSVKQLRINSWGEAYFDILMKESNITDVIKICKSRIQSEIDQFQDIYGKLIEDISNKNIEDVSESIKQINSQLNIKLVS